MQPIGTQLNKTTIFLPEEIQFIIRTNIDIDDRISEIALLFKFVPEILEKYDLWAKKYSQMISKYNILIRIDAAAKNAAVTRPASDVLIPQNKKGDKVLVKATEQLELLHLGLISIDQCISNVNVAQCMKSLGEYLELIPLLERLEYEEIEELFSGPKVPRLYPSIVGEPTLYTTVSPLYSRRNFVLAVLPLLEKILTREGGLLFVKKILSKRFDGIRAPIECVNIYEMSIPLLDKMARMNDGALHVKELLLRKANVKSSPFLHELQTDGVLPWLPVNLGPIHLRDLLATRVHEDTCALSVYLQKSLIDKEIISSLYGVDFEPDVIAVKKVPAKERIKVIHEQVRSWAATKKGTDDHLKALFFLLRLSIDSAYVLQEVDKLSSDEVQKWVGLFTPEEIKNIVLNESRSLNKNSSRLILEIHLGFNDRYLGNVLMQRPALVAVFFNRIASKGPEFVGELLDETEECEFSLLKNHDIFMALRPMFFRFLYSESGAKIILKELTRRRANERYGYHLTLLHNEENVPELLPLLSRKLPTNHILTGILAHENRGVSLSVDNKLTFEDVIEILSTEDYEIGEHKPVHCGKVFKQLLPLFDELNLSEVEELLYVRTETGVPSIFWKDIFSVAFPWMLKRYSIDEIVKLLTVYVSFTNTQWAWRNELVYAHSVDGLTPLHSKDNFQMACPYILKLNAEEGEKLLGIKNREGKSVREFFGF